MANSTTQFGGFLTNVGIAQQANTAALGLPWNITHMLIGDAGGEPSQTPDPTPKPTQNALVRQVYRAQLNALYQSPADPGVLVAELVLPPETGGWWIRELALEDANGNFIAVAKPAPSYKPLLAQGSGRTQTIRMHVVFGNLANVTLKIDPSIVLATRDYVDKAREAAELYARNQLKAHVEAADPHPQYLRRADVAKDAGPLAWLGAAGGTADALVLTLKSSEAALPAYAAGQRFQFQAVATNTGAVTARINGRPAVAVKKAGPGGLVDLVGGDVRAGALYDLNYDGTYFQLGGGVSAGKAFERFSFEASVGQKEFSAPHTVGNLIVMRNGREIIDYSADGQKITLHTACNLGDTVVILAFGAFRSVDGYTKAEVQALLRTSSGLPVGSMLPFPRGVVPNGFIEVDGSVQDIATYPDLAAYLGGAFNKGDEKAGEFRLPDSRGEFLRGWDHGRGIDVGRALGSWQAGQFESHDHLTYSVDKYSSPATLGSSGAVSLHSTGTTSGLRTGMAGGSETRPRNLAVMWCIKAWNAPVNQGQIDVAALVAELTALRSSTPVGAIIPFPKAEVPAGYLELDGTEKSIAAYPDLAAYLGTTYNKGDETPGNFRLPDYRGEFLRGWAHTRDVDAGRAIGSSQLGTAVAFDDATGFGVAGWHIISTADDGKPELFGADRASRSDYPNGNTQLVASATTTLVTVGMARPRNVAVMWCIKAWNAPVNQGQIDVAALASLAAQATETAQGTARVATQAFVNAGDDDATIVTPKKMRWGFDISLAANGYIIFPTWLGGLIAQWATTSHTGESIALPLPIAFPSACIFATVNMQTDNGAAVVMNRSKTNLSGSSLISATNATGTNTYNWLAIGY
ncbi:phage tail protein [Pseudomonas oryziphila]|uniref:Phage tail protein n=1 Tax=Pseudomonas oryziphila TaxID=2894079 RepID=A0ABN5TJD4_9PSED|nr:phage tail protein [Pseudomonas oryziphila]AZL75233.1 phage tail protein [Pseudomonas oryziphila]